MWTSCSVPTTAKPKFFLPAWELEMPNYGINDEGFTIKGLDVILSQSLSRAQQMFRKDGVDVDLTDTSILRKILQVTAQEDAELWKHMEDLYYANFVST